MAAIDFPNAPTLNQTFAASNGVTYKWDGAVWVSVPAGSAPPSGPASGSLAGTYPGPSIAASAVRGTPSSGGTAREIQKASIWGGDDLIDLSVPTTKLAAASATRGATSVTGTFPVGFASSTTGAFVTVLTLPALTGRGGWILITGGIGAYLVAPTGGAILYVQLTRNGTSIAAWRYDALGAGGNIRVLVPSVTWLDNPGAGTWTYAYQIQQTVAASFATAADTAGTLRAMELA